MAGPFPFRWGFLTIRLRAAPLLAMVPVTAWLVRNTLRNVGAVRPFKLEVLLLPLPNATWSALEIARSIVVARIVSISTTTLALPRLHQHLAVRPPSPRSPACLETGRMTDAGRKS